MSHDPDSCPGPAGAARDEAAAIHAALQELVRLKDMKTQQGETDDYHARRERAWAEARRALALRKVC